MRLYGAIQTRFWAHSSVQPLSDQSKLLATYLLSSSHTNMLGCFRLPVGYIEVDLKWSKEKVHQSLDELSGINYLTYAVTSNWVFIHNFLKYNTIDNPNQGKSIANLFLKIPKNLIFISHLADKLLEQDKHLNQQFINYLQTFSKQFPNQEQKQDYEQKIISSLQEDSENNHVMKANSSNKGE